MYYYLAYFLLFCILGSFFEETLKAFFLPNLKSGILKGPFVPVYGVGILIILLFGKLVYEKMEGSKLKRYVIIFFGVTIFLTLLEWSSGMLIETLFDKVMWNYDDIPFHFGHYISLPTSIGWGLGACLFLRYVKSLTDKVIKKIPKILTYLVLSIFLFDILYTFLF